MRILISILFLLTSIEALHSQVETDTTQEVKRFEIIRADNAIRNDLDSIQVDSLSGNVILLRDSVYLYCDSLLRKDETEVIAVGNVSIYHSDSLQVFCDSLFFSGEGDRAILKDRVVLKKEDEILKTDRMIYHLDSKEAVFNEGAVLRKGSTTIRSKKGKYFSNLKKAHFYQDVQVIDSTFQLQGDTLFYSTANERANFKGPTLVTLEDSKIYSEKGHYNTLDKSALFEQNPQYTNIDGTVATANRMIYDSAIKEMILEGEAVTRKGDQIGKAAKIVVNEEREETTFTGNAYYKDADTEIEAARIMYNQKTEAFSTEGGAQIKSDDSIITADDISTEENTSNQIASGSVIWVDTLNNSTLYCDTLVMNKESKTYQASSEVDIKTLFVKINEEDTLYLASDTLRFWEEEFMIDSLTRDTASFFEAVREVSIYKSGFQAVCDSLIFSGADSVFTLIDNSFLWSDSLQLTGDSILIMLVDDQVDRIHVPTTPFVIMDTHPILKDQMKGKELFGFFKEGKMDSLNIQGNAEAIKFLMDEVEAFIGMNKTEAGSIDLLFSDTDELYEIIFLVNPISKMKPMSNLVLSDTRLPGYLWNIEQKPFLIFFEEILSFRNEDQ